MLTMMKIKRKKQLQKEMTRTKRFNRLLMFHLRMVKKILLKRKRIIIDFAAVHFVRKLK